MMACYDDDKFSYLGFYNAVLSNFCFSGRAVWTKYLKRTSPDIVDDFILFQKISIIGMIFLFVSVITFEGRDLINWVSNTQETSLNVMDTVIFAVVLVINGAAFTTYNLVSYLVLSKTDIATHAVLNAFRRVMIIMFASVYFKTSLTTLNVFGVLIAVTSVGMFGYIKGHDSSKFKKYLLPN